MNFTQKHTDFEKKAQKIIGLTLLGVEYLEINYSPKNPKPYYETKYDEIDTIDFSLILNTNKQNIELNWDGEFHEYGIGINFKEIKDTNDRCKWNVSQRKIWKDFIGKAIIDVKLKWDEIKSIHQKTGKIDYYIYPQDMRIDFNNGKSIFVSAAGFLNEEDNTVMGMLDNLVISNNESLARKVKMID